MTDYIKLPELPSPEVTTQHRAGFGNQLIVNYIGSYTADQMRAYATAAIEADRKKHPRLLPLPPEKDMPASETDF